MTSNSAPSQRPSETEWRSAPSGTETGLRVLGALLERLPLRAAYVLVLPLVLMWFIHYNRPRVAVQRAMARMGRKSTLLSALMAYLEYAFVLVERYYLMAGRVRPTLDEAGRVAMERIVAEVEQDGPLVFLGGHCGALELGAVAIEELGRPVRPVAVHDPGAGALLAGVGDPSKTVGGSSRTIVADRSVASGLKMLKALRSGDILCFKADRVLPGAEGESVPVAFFGDEVRFPSGPVKIARTAKARSIVVSVFRTGPARYRLEAEVIDVRSGTPEDGTRAFAAALERQVATANHQWANFYPYWPSDEAVVAAHPEIVPLSARAAEHALWGGVGASVALAALDAWVGPGTFWAPSTTDVAAGLVGTVGVAAWGMFAGVLAAVSGIVAGGEKSPAGKRNARAHLAALLAPSLALAGPLLLSIPLLAHEPRAWSLFGAAWGSGALLSAVGPVARRPTLLGLGVLLAGACSA